MDSTPVIIISALLLILLTIGGIGLILLRHRRQRPYATVIDPEVRMQGAWDAWMEAELDKPQADLREEARRILDANQRRAILDDLKGFEEKILTAPYPLTQLRQEMMASVDRRMINIEILRLTPEEKRRLRAQQPELIQNDQHAREYIVANELRLAVLREYAARRYGDRAENDWLSVYERAAQFKRKNTRARIVRGLESDSESPEDARQQAMDVVDRQLQLRLLQVPPGTRFEREGEDKSPVPRNDREHRT